MTTEPVELPDIETLERLGWRFPGGDSRPEAIAHRDRTSELEVEPSGQGGRWLTPRSLGLGGVALLTGAFCGLVFGAIVQPPAAPLPELGRLVVTSEPSGALVAIDGTTRGVTPLTAMVAVGAHQVIVGRSADARQRTLRVTPGGEASVHVEWTAGAPGTPTAVSALADRTAPATQQAAHRPAAATDETAKATPVATPRKAAAAAAPAPARRAPSGWIAVTSPFPVRVHRDGIDLGGSGDGKLALPAGEHTLVLVNDALEFRDERTVTVVAKRALTLTVEAPLGVLHANARPWAEVWVDGRRAGDTPLGNVSLPVGEHEIVFRHPELGEAREVVLVGARTPARVAVELQP